MHSRNVFSKFFLGISGLSVATPAVIHAQAEDVRHMVVDALSMPGLEIPNNGDFMTAVAQLNANFNQQMQQNNANLSQQIQQNNANVNQQIQQLINTHNNHENDLKNLERTVALNANSNASFLAYGVFLPFRNAHGVIPEMFPRSVPALMVMTGPQMTALLEAYNVNIIPHPIEDRRVRVRELITSGN